MNRWQRWRCRNGHNWFLGQRRSEFIPVHDMCLRCGIQTVWLPSGTCVGPGPAHDLADHYRVHNDLSRAVSTTNQHVGPCYGPL